MNKRKHLLSISCLIIFFFLAAGSRVNKIHYGAFNYGNHVEDPKETQNYLVMNDGSKVYGDKVRWKAGLLVKDQIAIDEQKFKIKDVSGYLAFGIFYGRKGNEYIKRIVHGKINVYVEFTQVTSTSTDRNGFMHTRTYTRTDHYAQRGEDGAMVVFGGQKDILALVAGCPAAEEMANKSNRQIRKAIRADGNYMNEIFETYNNDCEVVERAGGR